MSSEISKAAIVHFLLKHGYFQIREKSEGDFSVILIQNRVTVPRHHALAAQAEIDREPEVSDAEALDLFRSMKAVESANLGPDGCGLGMRATLWLKAYKARAR